MAWFCSDDWWHHWVELHLYSKVCSYCRELHEAMWYYCTCYLDDGWRVDDAKDFAEPRLLHSLPTMVKMNTDVTLYEFTETISP